MKEKRLLARDDDGFYGFFEGYPWCGKDNWGDWKGEQIGDKINPDNFRLIFGCHPVRKGRKRKIKRILIDLED